MFIFIPLWPQVYKIICVLILKHRPWAHPVSFLHPKPQKNHQNPKLVTLSASIIPVSLKHWYFFGRSIRRCVIAVWDMSRSQGRIQVPDDLREVLLEFTISYLLEQPGDVVNYAADYFARLRETRTTQIVFDQAGTTASSPDESTLSREEGQFSCLVVWNNQNSDISILLFFQVLQYVRANL